MACNVNFFPLSPFTSIALLSFVPVIFAVKSLKIEKEKLHVKKERKKRARKIYCNAAQCSLKKIERRKIKSENTKQNSFSTFHDFLSHSLAFPYAASLLLLFFTDAHNNGNI